ncbi:hypothetical protein [Salinicoccus roseus]|uniref:hypothetical protein n=1 Tax=Salinicoccus roseus TaxID=45670 RepID=UPI0023016B52|nr:hypothetical protein [Salinicoccus roseus]
MEWLGWIFSIPVIGWLIREIIGNISKTKFIKMQLSVEHDYYKKRLLFDNKFEFYKDVYAKMRKFHGGLAAFEHKSINRTLLAVQNDAITKQKDYLSVAGSKENDLNRFVKDYNSCEIIRIAPNYDMTIQKIEDTRKDLNNYVSIYKFMFSEEEALITSFVKIS